jgi:hypothetical protein
MPILLPTDREEKKDERSCSQGRVIKIFGTKNFRIPFAEVE